MSEWASKYVSTAAAEGGSKGKGTTNVGQHAQQAGSHRHVQLAGPKRCRQAPCTSGMPTRTCCCCSEGKYVSQMYTRPSSEPQSSSLPLEDREARTSVERN